MNVTKVLGLAAVGALLTLAAPAELALALSLSNPGAAAAVQEGAKEIAGTTVVITAGIAITTGTITATGAAGERCASVVGLAGSPQGGPAFRW